MSPIEWISLGLLVVVVAAVSIEIRCAVLDRRDRKRVGAMPRHAMNAAFSAGYRRGRLDGEHGCDDEDGALQDWKLYQDQVKKKAAGYTPTAKQKPPRLGV